MTYTNYFINSSNHLLSFWPVLNVFLGSSFFNFLKKCEGSPLWKFNFCMYFSIGKMSEQFWRKLFFNYFENYKPLQCQTLGFLVWDFILSLCKVWKKSEGYTLSTSFVSNSGKGRLFEFTKQLIYTCLHVYTKDKKLNA